MTIHQGLAAGRWFTLTLAEQLGNVGSEFERAARWKEKGEPARFEAAFGRMLELMDLTLADRRWRGARLRELARVREEIREALWPGGRPHGPLEGLQKYFLAFAVAARRNA
jgi:hypothetical protein